MPDTTDLQSTGLIDFLGDALNSTLLADANSVDVLQQAIKEYGDETVEFTLPDETGKEHVISVPKLSIAPLPLLRIQEASFDMKGELYIDNTNTTVEKRALPSSLRSTQLSRRLRVISKTVNSEEKSGQTLSVNINVKMAQADMPAGLTNLLQIAANNLQIKDKK